ncbi:oxygenase [Actinoalloteichus sp. AHMU CJ021]|nr:oxygenase [Actinoalloteichus sp. AHMU CJ021]
MKRFELRSAERTEVRELTHHLLDTQERGDWDTDVEAITRAATGLPRRLREFLAGVRSAETDLSVISGLPVDDDLPPTPTGWDMAAKNQSGLAEELLLMLCSSPLGDPFSWATQQDGRLVHDICPSPGMENSLTSASSAKTLSLHTEDVFHPLRGDYVALLCLRNHDQVGTTVASVDTVAVPDSLEGLSRQPRFRFYPDDSHVAKALPTLTAGGDDIDRPHSAGSILFGPEQRPYLRFDRDFMDVAPGDDEAREAVEEWQTRLSTAAERVVLAPGDLVFVDNYRVVHGREPFAARYDGRDRWLKRVNLTRDVRRLYASSDRRSRVVAA